MGWLEVFPYTTFRPKMKVTHHKFKTLTLLQHKKNTILKYYFFKDKKKVKNITCFSNMLEKSNISNWVMTWSLSMHHLHTKSEKWKAAITNFNIFFYDRKFSVNLTTSSEHSLCISNIKKKLLTMLKHKKKKYYFKKLFH